MKPKRPPRSDTQAIPDIHMTPGRPAEVPEGDPYEPDPVKSRKATEAYVKSGAGFDGSGAPDAVSVESLTARRKREEAAERARHLAEADVAELEAALAKRKVKK